MKKRILAGLMTFVMVFSSAQTYAFAEDDVEEILTDLEEVEEKEEEELLGTSEDVRYKVTLDAGEGSFVIEEDEEVSKIDIYVTKGKTYEYSVRYLDPEGVTEGGEYVEYEELPEPEREGYDFFCWYLEEEHDEALREDKIITDDKDVIEEDELTFYAVWKEKETVEEPEDLDEDKALEADELKDAADVEDKELEETDADKKADDEELEEESGEDALDAEEKELTEDEETLEGLEKSDALEGINSLLGGSVESLVPDATQELLGDVPADHSGLWVETISPQYYTGQNITIPDLTVRYRDNEEPLQLGKDYSVAYKNNKNVGEDTATVTISLKGNYTGKLTTTFTILENSDDTELVKTAPEFVVNGKVQKGIPVLSLNGYKLKNGTDFTCTYPGTDINDPENYDSDAFVAVGSYGIHVTGKNGFTWEFDIQEEIHPLGSTDISKAKVTLNPKFDEGTYGTGVTYTSNLVVSLDRVLEEGTDYVTNPLSDEDDIKNGLLKYDIAGIGDCFGTKEVSSKIAGTPISKATFAGSSFEYDDTPKKQTLSYGEMGELVEGEHYTVTYGPAALLDNNGRPVKAGTVSATYTGINGFTGTVKKSFKIKPYNIATDASGKITATLVDGTEQDGKTYYPYAKNGTFAKVKVMFGEKELVSGTDYTLAYANNKALNGKKTPTVTVKGKGCFAGNLPAIEFAITAQNIGATGIVCAAADKVYAYKAGNYVTGVKVTDTDGKKLVVNTDYNKEFTYYYAQDVRLLDGTDRLDGDEAVPSDIVPADTLMKVVVSGKNSYSGETYDTYRIVTADISKASINVANQMYTGAAIVPDKSQVQVKLGNKILLDEDYEIVECKNNINKGKATIVIEGRGDYGGSKTGSFTIDNASAKFIVIFHPNGATSGKMNKQTGQPGKPLTLSANKYARSGYVFTGWDTVKKAPSAKEDNVAAEISDRGQISGVAGANKVLYAHWEYKAYKIVWHNNGGNNNPANTKTSYTPEDATFDILPPAEGDWKPGYQFGGWYTDPAYKNRISMVKKGTYGDLDLYAKWVPYNYTVTFDKNDDAAKGSMDKQTFSYGVSKKLNPNKFSKTGSVFMGWALAADGGVVFRDKEEITGIILPGGTSGDYASNFEEEMKLYAVWDNTFDITYDVPDNLFPTVPVHQYYYGQKMGLLSPSKPGYIFGGWYTDTSYKTKITSITTKTSGNLNLHAKWTPFKFTIVFDGKGGTGKTGNITATYADNLVFNKGSFVNKGHELTSWNAKSNPEDPETDGFPIVINSTTGLSGQISIGALADYAFRDVGLKNGGKIILYAQWEAVDHYTIKYHTNGGNSIPDEEYHFGDEHVLTIPEKDDDEFAGWYLDPQFKKKIEKVTESDYGDIDVYALWTANYKDAYTVSFVANEPYATNPGKMAVQKMNYGVSKALSQNRFKVKGYTFKGWSIDQSAVTPDYGDKEFVTGFKSSTSNGNNVFQPEVTLYAVWEKDTYTVTLNNVNAPEIQDAVATFTYNYHQEIQFGYTRDSAPDLAFIGDVGDDTEAEGTRYLAEPYKLGDTFHGWYTDAKFRKKVTSIPKGSTGNMTLYAKWETTRYTINYDLNAGNDATAKLDTDNAGYVMNYQGKYESGYLLATASRKNYRFGGWYKEKACKNAVGNIIGSPYVDMTVYAKWIPGSFTIKFDKNAEAATNTMKNMVNLKTSQSYRLTKNNYSYTGMDFVEWCTVQNPTNENPGLVLNDGDVFDAEALKQGDSGLEINDGDVITLYAQWTLHTYNISYHLGGGVMDTEHPNPVVFTMEDEVQSLNDPIRENCRFLGWYRDARYTVKVDPDPEDASTYAIPRGTTTDLHFYAKWKYETIPFPEPSDRLDVVELYGADNTGQEDATDAINRAINKASSNYGSSRPSKVYIPSGTYKISISQGPYKCALMMQNNVSIFMEDDTILQLTPEDNSSDVCAIMFIQRHNVHLIGGKLIGAGTENTRTDRYGLWIKGCENVSISDMEIAGMQCDGFYIAPQQVGSGTPAENEGNNGVTISNCVIHDNRRNNISIVDCDNLVIQGCNIYNAGNRSPHCGICIEPNDDCSGDGKCTDIYIVDTTIRTGKSGSNWEYRTFYTYNNHGSFPIAENVTIENCYLEGYYGNYNGRNIKLINTTIVGTKDG